MHISRKFSLIKTMSKDRRVITIAPVLASLWLSSCVTVQGDRSTKLNTASSSTSQVVGGGALQSDRGVSSNNTYAIANRDVTDEGGQSGVNDAGSSQSIVADAGSQSSVGADAFESMGRRVALVIGNSDYSKEIGRLANPSRDAYAIADALESTGFEVSLLQDVSREEMMRAVLEFDEQLRDTDVGLFYYAGHAIQVNGRNFMIPTEAKLDIASTRQDAIADYVALETVEIDDVLGRMGNAEAKLNIVILDACRNNPFNDGTRGLSRGLAQTSAPRGTFVAYATSPGKVAQDGNTGNSPYTASLVRNLGTPGLKLEDVFKRVRQDVAEQTDGQQIPWENSSVFGDFYFAEPEPELAPEPETQTVALPPLGPTGEPEAKAPTLTQEDYAEVQRLLSRIGHYRGPITGKEDEKTQDAITKWQENHDLELDGKLSKVHIALMRSDAASADLGLRPEPTDFDDTYLPPLKAKEPSTRELVDPPVKKRNDMLIIPPPPA